MTIIFRSDIDSSISKYTCEAFLLEHGELAPSCNFIIIFNKVEEESHYEIKDVRAKIFYSIDFFKTSTADR